METLKKVKELGKKPKVQLAVGLAVASAFFLTPHKSLEDASSTHCTAGSAGDCEANIGTTNNELVCTTGWFWNDCGGQTTN